MALETLKGVEKIGGFAVLQERPKKADGSVDWDLFDEQRKSAPIYVDHDVNMISFRIQDGPIKENGINGCQLDTLIHAAKMILDGLNNRLPNSMNHIAMASLETAIGGLLARTEDREKRNVEGTSKA